ncbi:branched-chain-amino-acid transaminase, partial [Papiliotrema laurentii]
MHESTSLRISLYHHYYHHQPLPPAMSHTPTSALSADNIFFHPLPPAHSPLPGKESHGRYMLTVPWSRVSGWGQPKISPRAELSFDPLSGVLQYAVTCFEGMKCYKRENGDLTLFRPKANFNRLKRSAARLGLPSEWDNDELLSLLSKLLALEAPLVPQEDGGNLYIRPNIVETSEGSVIQQAPLVEEALLYIVTTVNFGKKLYPSAESPEQGLKLDANKEFIRAWPGGTGSYKLGANYGPVSTAKKQGYAMSLWLHGKEDYISEAGAMNMFVIKQAQDGYLEFITMSLENGIVLPGITRDSIINLLNAHAKGENIIEGLQKEIRVVERDIGMPELVAANEDGSLKGMFGCGTGIVVVSIREILYEGKTQTLPYAPVVLALRDTMTALHRGKKEYQDWLYVV